MTYQRKLSLIYIISILPIILIAQGRQELVLYKQIDTTKLYMEVFHPPKNIEINRNPAMVFFFGGGWVNGNRGQFKHHAEYFSSKGITCFLVDYRIKGVNHTTPFDCLKDAKSAIRFVKANGERFKIDSSRVVLAGGSAGGHLAAATAIIEGYNEESDDLSISTVASALVLFNPVIDNGPGGFGYDIVGEAYKNFSPLHNIHRGVPPIVFMVGTNDRFIPVETAEYFKLVVDKVGGRCDLILYPNQKHGFFNYNENSIYYYEKTIKDSELFLKTLGYIKE